MNNLINKSQVKKYLLSFAEANRAHKFNRVSQETMDRVEAAARSACKAIVTQAPSKGKTL
jgi:predicted neutral ceramidase superfamily lipid hydrolase